MNRDCSVISSSIRSLQKYQSLVCLFGMMLVISTWRLWYSPSQFPQVPLLSCLVTASPVWDQLGLVGIQSGFLLVVVSQFAPICKRIQPLYAAGSILLMLSLFCMFLLSAHRVQVWSYQFFVILTIALLLPAEKALNGLKWFVISIYFYSAFSKLDVSFMSETGPWMLTGLLESVGISTRYWETETIQKMSLILPIWELIAAVSLCCSCWGTLFIIPAMLMHILLLLTFSPWNLNQSTGVLLWNLFFLIQLWFLFVPKYPADNLSDSQRLPFMDNFKQKIGWTVLALAILLPCWERSGYFDTWPGWAVYAGHPEKLHILVHHTQREQLPDEIRNQLSSPQWQDGFCRLQVQQWSLKALRTPMIPETRVRLGVALSLAERYDLKQNIRVKWESTADRFTGKRVSHTYTGVNEILEFSKNYIMNFKPRIHGQE